MKLKAPISPRLIERNASIVAAWRAGSSIADLTKQYALSDKMVGDIVRRDTTLEERRAVFSRRAPSKWTPERLDELRKLHAAGKSNSQMAALMGVTLGAICGRRWRLGLPDNREVRAPRVAPPTIWTPKLMAKARELHEQALPDSMIAKELGHGLSRNAVRSKLNRMGLRLAPDVAAANRARAGSAHASSAKPYRPPVPRQEVVNGLPADAKPMTVATAHALGCRFPIDAEANADMRMCGAPAVGPYCNHHKRIVYVPTKVAA